MTLEPTEANKTTRTIRLVDFLPLRTAALAELFIRPLKVLTCGAANASDKTPGGHGLDFCEQRMRVYTPKKGIENRCGGSLGRYDGDRQGRVERARWFRILQERI